MSSATRPLPFRSHLLRQPISPGGAALAQGRSRPGHGPRHRAISRGPALARARSWPGLGTRSPSGSVSALPSRAGGCVGRRVAGRLRVRRLTGRGGWRACAATPARVWGGSGSTGAPRGAPRPGGVGGAALDRVGVDDVALRSEGHEGSPLRAPARGGPPLSRARRVRAGGRGTAWRGCRSYARFALKFSLMFMLCRAGPGRVAAGVVERRGAKTGTETAA